MAIRNIRVMGDRVLNKVCRPVEQMTDKDPKDTWGLTLFTCTPGGAERVTVRCHRTGLVAKE